MSFLRKIFGINDSKSNKCSIYKSGNIKTEVDDSRIEVENESIMIEYLDIKTDVNDSRIEAENESIMIEYLDIKTDVNDSRIEAENESIMCEYLEKYLSNKSPKYKWEILNLFRLYASDMSMEPQSVEKIKIRFNEYIEITENSKKSKSSVEDLMTSDRVIESYLNCLLFIEDLSKLLQLFRKKGIDTDYIKIYNMFIRIITNYLDKLFDENLLGYYEFIKNKVGNEVSNENVIYAILGSKLEKINSSTLNDDASFWILECPSCFGHNDRRLIIECTDGSGLGTEAKLWILNKFNLSCTWKELNELLVKVKSDIELENFERELGSIHNSNINTLMLTDFSSLNGYEFEDFLFNLFVNLGYRVIKTPYSRDQGADLILYKSNISTVVQAKNYKDKVSNIAIQQIVAAKNYYEADAAMVVTNSVFTKSAVELAYANNVDLWDGNKLREVANSI